MAANTKPSFRLKQKNDSVILTMGRKDFEDLVGQKKVSGGIITDFKDAKHSVDDFGSFHTTVKSTRGVEFVLRLDKKPVP